MNISSHNPKSPLELTIWWIKKQMLRRNVNVQPSTSPPSAVVQTPVYKAFRTPNAIFETIRLRVNLSESHDKKKL